MGFGMIDGSEHFERLRQACQIWDRSQFTVQDVCAITGATAKALEHFVDPARGMVRLVGEHVNPGKGKRRLFTGGQVLMINAAFAMNRLGFPQRFSMVMSEQILRRAEALTTGLAQRADMMMVTYPMKNGDWAVVPVYGEQTEERLPVCVQLLDVDRLISETKDQLEAIVAGESIPDFTVPDIAPEPNPYSPRSNFFRNWEKDEKGRWKYVGLTWEESEELLALQGARLVGDDLEDLPGHERSPEGDERYLELHDRMHAASLRAAGLGSGID